MTTIHSRNLTFRLPVYYYTTLQRKPRKMFFLNNPFHVAVMFVCCYVVSTDVAQETLTLTTLFYTLIKIVPIYC
jgi:hypothetical protein